MDVIQTEMYGVKGNCAIVKLPNRNFPGILLQGDTVKMIEETLTEAATVETLGEARAAISDVAGLIKEYLSVYEDALMQASVRLPYVRE